MESGHIKGTRTQSHLYQKTLKTKLEVLEQNQQKMKMNRSNSNETL
jgi:hypothetical protein